MYDGEEALLFDFSGGMASASFSTSSHPEEANLLRNVFVRIGNGIEKRKGNTLFNSSAMASGLAVTGLEACKFVSGTEYFVATCGATIQQGDITGSTMTDITGAVTVTSSANNLWTISMLNDLAIGVGGAPDAPWKWSGSGNAAALGGSPPSGAFGFQHNNRMFIGGITGNLSRIQWSILGNPEDWSSAGSGTQDVWKNDGDTLVGAAVIAEDNVLLFKQRSIHRLVGRSSPFPVVPVFRDVGAVGKKAIVVADGLVYFITPRGRMLVTDGNYIIDEKTLPRLMYVDDIWAGLNQSRLQHIQGKRYVGVGFDHIVWLCSNGSSSTNNLAIVWDLKNKCWLQHTSGYGGNALTKTQAGALYMGAYDGKIYKQDVTNTYSDASETSPGAIDAYWRSGWLSAGTLKTTKNPSTMQVVFITQTVGVLSVGYGFDYNVDKIIESKSMQEPGGLWDVDFWDIGTFGGQSDFYKTVFIKGRGNLFEFSLGNNLANQTFQIHGLSIGSKKGAQKVLEAA